MGAAIGFAALCIVLGIFMPDVLHAASVFLLTLFEQGTAALKALPAQPAMVSYPAH